MYFQFKQQQTELNVWWSHHPQFRNGYFYKVVINDNNCAYTNKRYYDFYNLTPNTTYVIKIQLVDENKQPLADERIVELTTIPNREIVNVCKEPYALKGNEKEDNSNKFQKLIDESNGKTIYFPMGIYKSEEVTMSGNIDFCFSTDSSILENKEEI